MHVAIDFCPVAGHWERLGTFTVSTDQVRVLRELLEGRDPYEVLDKLPKGQIFDSLDMLRSEGHDARVTFYEDT